MSAIYDNRGFDKSDLEKGDNRTNVARESQVQLSFKKERTGCERRLIFFVVVLLLAVIGLIIAVVLLAQESKDEKPDVKTTPATTTTTPKIEICNSPQCTQASAALMENMDMSVDPCEDFYMFSCGTWKKKNLIPEDSSGYNRFSEVSEDVELISKNLLEHTESYQNVSAITKARDMFASCNNVEKIEEKGPSVAVPFLDELGGWPVLGTKPGGNWSESNFSLARLLTSLLKYNNYPVIALSVYSDIKDSEKHIIYLDQPSFGLPGRLYYLEESLWYMREAYVTLASSVAQLFGADEEVADREMREMLELETELANISLRSEDRRDIELLYNKMTISELKQLIKEPGPDDPIQFDWLEYISGVFDMENVKIPVNESEPVVVFSTPYFEKVFSVLQKYGKRAVANYMVWTAMKHRAGNLDSRFREILQDYNHVLYGIASSSARWKGCVYYTQSFFGMALGHMFVKERFDESSKEVALDMIGQLRKSFAELLEEIEWMDEPTKKLAREKAEAIKNWIGYPDYVIDVDIVNWFYENATIDKDEYFTNVLNNLMRRASGSLKVLREKFNKNVWTSAPTEVNAYYDGILNAIMFPAGILQPPFYHKDYPKSMNYGGIGVVIGHEITHGFDDQGRLFDKYGNLDHWWNASIIENFKEKAQCMIDQYSQYVVPEVNMNINGINTQGENIADNGGLKQSFRAYRNWVEEQGKEEPMLPGLNFTHNQLFFISFGQVWCANKRKESMIYSINTGVHSPKQFRVIGSVQNSPEFTETFGCKRNSNMNPEKKCTVW